MSAAGEDNLAPAQHVDPTAHRPLDCCEYCDNLDECPGYLGNRTRQQYRVEGWEHDAWTMMSGAKDTIAEAELRMEQLKARFPEAPMRVVAETTSHMVVRTAPGQTPPTDGDQMT